MKLKPIEIAEICHNVNKAYCESIGDHSWPEWDDLDQELKDSAVTGVNAIFAEPTITPEQGHAGWLAFKREMGWKYDKKKDPIKKTHPCMVSYNRLPKFQKTKGALFTSVVKFFVKEMM